jgi:hypothetical protein
MLNGSPAFQATAALDFMGELPLLERVLIGDGMVTVL